MKATDELVTKVSADGYNKTQLNVIEDMERHIFHRDRLAHFFRWAHVMRAVKPGQTVLDLGCGTGNLATMLYANRLKVHYVGIDIRSKTLERVQEYFASHSFDATFLYSDLCKDGWETEVDPHFTRDGKIFTPDIITSFEFVEHIPGEQVEPFLLRTKKCMDESTVFYLSTPCFDGVRKAENHVKEWYYSELRDLLEKHFNIEKHWGTFISQKEFEKAITYNPASPTWSNVGEIWNQLKEYYGSETLAILFAPLFPVVARNCIWKLRTK